MISSCVSSIAYVGMECDELCSSLVVELSGELFVFDGQHVDDSGERVDGLLLLSALLIEVGQATLCRLELIAKSLLALGHSVLSADSRVEFFFEIGVAVGENMPLYSGFGREGDDRECTVGTQRSAGEQAVHRIAYVDACRVGGHAGSSCA
jgi:hypothetical protein